MPRVRKTTLHVFISSPGDCAEERALMRDVVRRVSVGDEARAANIQLVPLLWEELPPGQAEPGDLQARVNALLDRYGLKRYEVYAGAMKGRLGTPTAKFRSGTIEELETAIAGYRRSQVPAEVLFYFIESDDPEVRAFREELSARGFLFAVVADRAELEERFTAHLTRIVSEWSLWRNRMRRAFRSARSATAIAAGILLTVALTAYLMFDRGGASRVQEALRSGGPGAALAVYEREAPYLVAHKAFTKRELREALTGAIGKGVLEDSSARPAAAMWQRATRAGVWAPDDAEARRLLRRIAARRFMEALLADGIDVGGWPQRCRPFEMVALREFAHEAVRAPLDKWPGAQRNAVCVLAEAWPRLGTLAVGDASARVLMVQLAPPEVARRWILENVGKSMGDPEVHDLVLAGEERQDPAVLSALLDCIAEGKIDRAVHLDDLLRAVEPIDRKAFEPYAIHHLRRLNQGVPAPAELYPVLLSFVPPSIPESYIDTLAKPVLDDTASGEYEVAAYRAIADRGDVRARGFLLLRYDEYRSERTSYGFAQKAALIDALTATRVPSVADRALALAKIARRETEERSLNDWIVQAAYLRALASDVTVWPRHASYVRELFARRATAELSLVPDGMEAAAVDVLGKLSSTQIIDLLALPASIVSDELEGKWEPRCYVLRALAEAGPVDDEIASAVFARMPIDDDLRLRVARAVSRGGGKVARAVLASEYLRDRAGNRGYLDFLADLGEETFFLHRMTEAADDAVLKAAERLPEGPRCRVFARAAQRFGATHAQWLWNAAAGCRITDDALVDAAVRQLKKHDPESAAAPMKYLAAIGREGPAISDAVTILDTAEPFYWVALAQELPAHTAKDSRIEALLGGRALLVVTDNAGPGSFSAGERGIFNPLLAVYAARADLTVARKLLEWGVGAKSVEVEGRADDAPVLYRAYCLWLAATGARGLSVNTIADDFEVTSLLAENTAPLVRASAAVCLASTSGERGEMAR